MRIIKMSDKSKCVYGIKQDNALLEDECIECAHKFWVGKDVFCDGGYGKED
jgi:hypothetical protein